jgi:phospholipid/cholesterol/gamma-HCH transport system substrate-binding protein
MEFVDLDSLRRVRVVGAISKKVWPMLTTEAEVLLGSIGFLGDKYIEVIPYPTKGEPLHNMDVIKTRYAGDVKAVFKEAEEAAATAGSVAVNLDSLLGRMNRGEGTLGKLSTSDQLYVNLTHLSSDLASLVADLQANQERVIGSIERLSTSVADLSEQVNSNSGTIGRLVNDPDLYENLNASTARLDSVLARINSAEGSLGLMVSDTALYVETAELLKRVNNLITDIQRNPKKYFKFSVF